MGSECHVEPPKQGTAIPVVLCGEKCTCCKRCVRACNNKAILIEGNSPVIDSEKCQRCGECMKACPKGVIGYAGEGLTGEKTSETSFARKKSNEISPRMAYLLHELCTGCGHCSRSFYCDSFLDREGKDRPPLMDPKKLHGMWALCANLPAGSNSTLHSKPRRRARRQPR